MYTSSIPIDTIIDTLADFIHPFTPNCEIIRGDQNRTSMPESDFVELTEILQADIDKPYSEYDASTADIKGGKRIDIQVDIYSPNACNYITALEAAFRTPYACSKFPANIQPLYTSEPMRSPLISGEQQYVTRWLFTVSLQFNPVVTVPQETADTLSTNINTPVDLT
jgi:hypothetical protein